MADVATAQRFRFVAEYVILFFGLVGGYALLGSPGSPIPFLVVLAGAAWLYLRREPTFDRDNLWRAGAVRAELPSILRLSAVVAVTMVVAVAVWSPDRLFGFPREEPVMWLVVVILYPLLSVYPQELLFRAFLMHRYAHAFGSGTATAAASAAAFGFAHIIFGTVMSVLLTLVAGWMFARRYHRSRSLLAASIEHALFGVLAFTIGLGHLFYHGAADG
ncbi:type II CAAX prenyl endopeptidase Rce1 family protein [Mycolicibacterium iranicum]|uniref:CAAX protease n=1 Tax=Mycolicibacterium iranicum TaxID=912594 RepID=A0A178M1C5_MYCIR|nr:CPBP family glutamic-type intramembrane protease [Mycolicibacterium iranicum]OAN41779.1 CAAX protease [Mycolicibacterium iranicum]